jgi:photosystem II stability/assembly factor-like uncharacterized protein
LYSQWYQQSYPVSNTITGIEFVDSLKGWASTSSNLDTSYILHTTNGGTNWIIQHRMTGADFEVLDAVDSSVIYVGGYRYSGPPWTALLKTTNGGKNWIDMNVTVSLGFDDMFFVNRDSGYMCEDSFRDLYRTTNGGISWVMRNSGINSIGTRRLFFLDYNTGYCGASFTLFKTTNAGDNWVAVNGFSDFIYSIFFLDEITGWIGLANIKLSKTTNMGINWISQTLPDFFGSTVHDIKFINENTGWAGQFFITVLKTTNGGNIWGYQFDSSGSTTISIFDSSKGWSGFRGIESTFNGGGTITKISSYTNVIPTVFALFQNYPNPFNASTKITFEIKASSIVKLKIYDITGREINKWESNGALERGRHEFLFDAGGMSSGVYFYKMEVTGQTGEKIYSESRKMMLVK